MQDEVGVTLAQFNDFLIELNSISKNLRETRGTFHPIEAVSIFYELGTNQEIKEKLLIFAQCMVEISKDRGIPDPRSRH